MEQRWDWRTEISGALGDVGVFFPIAVALISLNGMSATAILVAAGLFYILSGLYFGLPMPVQPMKALAVIAIAARVSPAMIAAAGLIIGGLVLILTVFGGLEYLASIFPKTLVRGIQLGIGLILLKSGAALMMARDLVPAFPSLKQGFWGPLPYGLWIGLAVAILLLLYGGHRSLPATPLVILFGVLMGWFLGMAEGGIHFVWGPSPLSFPRPSSADFATALWMLALPQLPLSFGNALVGTASAARSYFPDNGKKVTVKRLGLSYGLANIASALMGGMPMCQGAGGLTAHFRFGARTARAPILLGSLFLGLALFMGESAPALLSLIPSPILGALLGIVGWEHCRLARDVLPSGYQTAVAAVVGVVSVYTGNLLYALLAGLTVGLMLRATPPDKSWPEVFGPSEQL